MVSLPWKFLSQFSKDWVTRTVIGNILRCFGCKPRELKDTFRQAELEEEDMLE